MKSKKRIALSAIMVGLSVSTISPGIVQASSVTNTYAETLDSQEVIDEPESDETDEPSQDISEQNDQSLEREYSEYLESIENDEQSQNPSSDEMAEEGDLGEEVIFGGITPGTNTGYVNVFTELPEYVHENAYAIILNLNTGEMYGCRTYEVNGFQAQICVPAGIYMISEGGLSSDSVGRFYAMNQQFQVKPGSQQTIIAKIVDTKPELADQAYPENEATGNNDETNNNYTEPESQSEITEKPKATLEETASQDNKKSETSKKSSIALTIVLTVLFTVIPLGILAGIYVLTKKRKRGFDE